MGVSVTIAESTLAAVRQRLARALAAQGVKQARIATLLGASQGMVSRYLRQPLRPVPSPQRAHVEAFVTEVARYLRAGAELDQLVDASLEMVVRTPVRSPTLRREGSRVEALFRLELAEEAWQRQEALADLQAAVTRLEGDRFLPLAPQVQLNIGRATDDATDPADVASVPGRVTNVRGRLLALAPPEFGASHHLSRVLLAVRQHRPDLRAVLNVRFGPDVAAAVKTARLPLRTLSRRGTAAAGTDGDEALAVALGALAAPSKGGASPLALADPGAFAIEPCLYLFAPTAIGAVTVASEVLARLPRHRTRKIA